jgi:serine/threonine protein kinase
MKKMRLPSEYSSPVLLGKGAYSSVYRVYQQRLDRTVAIKTFRSSSGKKLKAICSEAQMLGKFNIPCVPHVYDISFRGSQAFIVMEWIRGIPLDRLMQIPLSLSLRKTIATKLIEAVGQLHAQNVVHRDLKPQNIIVTPDDRLYLIDFGFASDKKVVMYQSDSIQGTPRYIAPECWKYDKPVNYVKNDIFALGILINDLIGSDLPEHIIYCSSPDPENRPENVQEFFSTWKNSICFNSTTPEWHSVISTATHRYLATQYFTSALDLKRRGQIKNAYQVLAELLDEMPDHSQAITLLQSLSIGKSKRNRMFTVISAVLIIVLGTTTFFMGKFLSETESIYRLQPYRPFATDSLITPYSSVEKSLTKRSPFFKNDASITCIKAELICQLPDTFGSLFVDGKQVDTCTFTTYPEIRISLDQGIHSIRWTSKATDATTIESVTLLPFERKRIKLTFFKE